MVSNATIPAVLKSTILFEGLTDETLVAIAVATTRRSFEDGASIYEIGDEANDVFVVETGRVQFFFGTGSHDESSGSIVTSGQAFAWAAMLEGRPRRVALARCLETSTVLAINGNALLEIFTDDTAAGYHVMSRLTGLITNNFMEALAT